MKFIENKDCFTNVDSFLAVLGRPVHPLVERAARIRYERSAKRPFNEVKSGTLSQWRRGTHTAAVMNLNLLEDEELIDQKVHYYPYIERLRSQVEVLKGEFAVQAEHVGLLNATLDLVLDHLLPEHIYLDQVEEIVVLHIPVDESWRVR